MDRPGRRRADDRRSLRRLRSDSARRGTPRRPVLRRYGSLGRRRTSTAISFPFEPGEPEVDRMPRSPVGDLRAAIAALLDDVGVPEELDDLGGRGAPHATDRRALRGELPALGVEPRATAVAGEVTSQSAVAERAANVLGCALLDRERFQEVTLLCRVCKARSALAVPAGVGSGAARDENPAVAAGRSGAGGDRVRPSTSRAPRGPCRTRP